MLQCLTYLLGEEIEQKIISVLVEKHSEFISAKEEA